MTETQLNDFKHREICECVQAAIFRGEYSPGDAVPSVAQLMRQFGASRHTVSRAMRKLEAAGLLERRGPRSLVRKPAAVETRPLGLLVPRLDKAGMFVSVCDEIARAAQAGGFHAVWADVPGGGSGDSREAMRLFCRQCVKQRVKGVFFAPLEIALGMDINREVAADLDRAGIALVLLDHDFETFPRRSKFDLVAVNHYRIGYLQTDHLLTMGCRHIEHLWIEGRSGRLHRSPKSGEAPRILFI